MAAAILGQNYAGVLAFDQPTANYLAQQPILPTDPDLTASSAGFNTLNLSLGIDIPEPNTFGLASLGAALLLISRRRK